MTYDHNDIRARVEAAFRLRGNANPSASIIDDVIEIVRSVPVPMRLHCPVCHLLHIDVGEFADKPHRDHVCQSCGMVWRPALVPTVGVRFLPGHKNKPEEQIVDGQSPSEHKITLTSDGIYTCVCGAIGTFAELTDFNHKLFEVARR